MTIKRIIFTALILSVFISCNSDDNNNSATENPLNTSWNLSNVFGGIIATDIDYQTGDVTWTFDTENELLTIENNILTQGPEQLYSGPESGVYAYELVIENLDEVLYIEGQYTGVINMENNTLQIDNGIATDGFVSTYIQR